MSQETIRAAERAAGQVKTMSTYDPDSDQLHEECGIFGVWAPDRDVARLTYFGLRALQHRGQESAGIAVGDGGTVMVRKDLGLLDRVFSNADLSTLSGQLAVGHVRYGTAGAKSWEASQPHLSTINSDWDIYEGQFFEDFRLTPDLELARRRGFAADSDELRRQLIELGVPFLSNSDSEVATKLIGYFTQRTGHLREGIRKTMELVRGGRTYAVAGVSVGGGEIEMTELEGFPVCLRGNEDGALFIARRRLGRRLRDVRARYRGRRVRP